MSSMMRTLFLTAAFFFTLTRVTSTVATANAKDGKGTAAVRAANEAVAKLFQKKVAPKSAAETRLAAKVTARVRDFLDVDQLGQRALVDHWAGLSAAERSEFIALLRELIEASYVRGLRANLDYETVYLGETVEEKTLVVRTEIKAKRKGRPYSISIDYVLRKEGETLRAFDVVTDGVGLIENYRAQFNKIIAKEGFSGLLARMKRKRDR